MALQNSETAATFPAIAVTVPEFTDTNSEYAGTFTEFDVTNSRKLRSFIDLFGRNAAIHTRIHRYKTWKDQGGVTNL